MAQRDAEPRQTPVTSPISIDRTVALAGAIVALLSLLRIPDHLGWSVDTTTAIAGYALAAMASVRAWWEGRELIRGGSFMDPAAALGAAIFGTLGVLDVPSALELTPAMVTGLVSTVLAAFASWRDGIRRAIAQRRAAS